MKQFPSIFRFIPDYRFHIASDAPLLFVGFFSGVMLTGIILQSVFVVNNMNKLQTLQTKRTALENQVLILSNYAKTHSSYRDLYLELATLEYRLGNTTEARAYLQRAMVVDPNSEAVKNLAAKLQE